MQRFHRHQGDRGVIHSQLHGTRVILLFAAAKQIDVLTPVLFIAERAANLAIKRQVALSGDVISARRTAEELGVIPLLRQRRQRIVIVGGKTQEISPGFGPQAGTVMMALEIAVEHRVIPQQPIAGDPTLAKAKITQRTLGLLQQAELAIGQQAVNVIQRAEQLAATAGKIPLVGHHQRQFGVTQR
ncbi:hypothetical protein D3C80_1049690 [compost metagenome]